MGKKGAISLYIVLGLMLIVLALLTLFASQPDMQDKKTGLELDLSVTATKNYIESCLAQVTKSAVDTYGFIGVEKELSDFIEKNVLICLNDFEIIRLQDVGVEYQDPEAVVLLNDNSLSVELNFPVILSDQDKQRKIDYFRYLLLRRTSLNYDNSHLPRGTMLISEDEDLILEAYDDMLIKGGPEKGKLILKVNDRQFNGNENSLVLGNIIYEGLPDGLMFDAPFKGTLRIRKEDLPAGFSPAGAKLSYFDKIRGIWMTYGSQSMEEDQEYYYYSASIDHFTPMAVVYCSGDKEDSWQYPMSFVYRQPVEPAFDWAWKENPDKKGMHLLPELMMNATCDILDTMHYSLEDNGITRENACSKDPGLLRDWDKDDLETAKQDSYKYAIQLADGSLNEVSSVSLGDGSDAKKACYEACSKQVKIDLGCYYGGKCSPESGVLTQGIVVFTDQKDKWFDPFEEIKIGKEKTKLASGDGINDKSKLTCSMTGEKMSLDKSSIRCIIEPKYVKGADIVPKTKGFEFIKMTLDMEDGFYATPMSYGYPVIEGEEEVVGGMGFFEFEFKGEGNSCLDTSSFEAAIYGDRPEAMLLFKDGAIKDKISDPLICNIGDECLWSMNNPDMLKDLQDLKPAEGISQGKISAGSNFITVKVKNAKDAAAYGQAYLMIKGAGIQPDKSEKAKTSALSIPASSSAATPANVGGQMGGSTQAGKFSMQPGSFEKIQPGIELKMVDTKINSEIPLPRRVIYYVVKIDLEQPGIGFYVTPRSETLQTVTQFMANYKDKNIKVAINANPFTWGGGNENVGAFAASEGDIYSDPKFKPEYGGGPTVVMSEKSTVTLGKENPDGMYNAVTGFQTVLQDGKVVRRFEPDFPKCPDPLPDPPPECHKLGYDIKNPRTSIGLVKNEKGDGYKYMLLIVVDGRGESGGVDMKELALIHQYHDADLAANMDGGGSSDLVIDQLGIPSIVNTPSDPQGERAVANHLGITLDSSKAADGSSDDDDDSGNSGGIDNFREVTSEIWAGGQPKKADIDSLAEKGVKTIIDVSGAEVSWEQSYAASKGINYIFAPLGIYSTEEALVSPLTEVSNQIDSSLKPVYVHCQYGAHRTGVAIGAYRIRKQDWDYGKTEAEMIKYAGGSWPAEYRYFLDAVKSLS